MYVNFDMATGGYGAAMASFDQNAASGFRRNWWSGFGFPAFGH